MKSIYKTLGIIGISLTVCVATPLAVKAEEPLPISATSQVVEADDCLALANQALAVKDYRNTIHHANRAIDLNPNEADAYLLRGQAKLALGQEDGAVADLQRAATQYLQRNNREGYQAAREILSRV